MYKKYRIKLDEFIEYKAEVDARVNEYKETIQDKQKQVEQLEKDFASSFISGKGGNDKKLKTLKSEIVSDKQQLELIEKAMQSDKTLKEKANAVFKEYEELGTQVKKDFNKYNEDMTEVNNIYKRDTNDINNKRLKSKTVETNQAKERLEAKEFMDIADAQSRKLDDIAERTFY